MKAELRIIEEGGQFCISEVQYDDEGKIKEILADECGILSYWMSIDDLKDSYTKAGLAFGKPVINRTTKTEYK